MQRRIILSLLLSCLVIPVVAFGSSVSITEIMYDASGTDAGHEWIEIYNDSGASIDLTKYKLTEGTSSHGLVPLGGNGMLENKNFAIIAENPEIFSSLYPNVKKEAIYDASFSLSNSNGENIGIKDSEGNVVYEFTYDTSIGANGDGNSLQYSNNKWIAGLPTPLDFYSLNSPNNNTGLEAPKTTTSIEPVPKKQAGMRFVFNAPEKSLVGIENNFQATFYGENGEIITNGRFVWNFGDGTTTEQNNLSPVTHEYGYPGTYIVTCSYKYTWANKNIYTGKTVVSVINSPFKIDEFYNFPFPAVKISNTNNNEYDMYGYIVTSNVGNFVIQENTYIGGKDEVVIRLPTGDYDANSIKLIDPYKHTVSSFYMPVSEVNTVKEVPMIYHEPKPQVLGANTDVSQIDTSYSPIQIEEDAKPKDNVATYFVLGIILLISGASIFLIQKNKNQATNIADDYTLQDE